MFTFAKKITIVCFVISLSTFGNASTVNMPVKVIDFKSFVVQEDDRDSFSCIYKLCFENGSFNVLLLSAVLDSGMIGCSHVISQGKLINWDIEKEIVSEEEILGSNPTVVRSVTITNSESIEINGNPLVLEDSHVPHHVIQDDIYRYDASYEKCLSFAVVSYEENLAGGLMTEVIDDNGNRTIETYHYIALWSLRDGKKQFERRHDEEYPKCEIYFIDLCFNHAGRYLKVKHLGIPIYVPEPPDTSRVIYIPTSVKLIDTHTFEQLPADKVAAFSSGDTYMFTEWEGEPAIVHVDSLRVAQKVSVPEPMTAAVFSPDGSKLYVATVENMIYVYDTPLTSTAGTWECYK